MKRKVLCIFSLIAYLLLFCTVLAPTVEREMATLADVKQLKANTMTNTNLPGYAVRWGDVEGLFHIVQGSGWNTGSRVEEIPRQYYVVSYSHIILHPGTPYSMIVSASRTPRAGDRVEPVEAKERPGEKLIVYCPQGIAVLGALQNNFTVLQQGEKGILLDTMGIKMPYFEHRMREALEDRIIAEGMRIYSYTEAKAFLGQLPLLAVVGALLVVGICLWGSGCRLTKYADHPIKVICINGTMMVLVLLVSLPVMGAVDLPASLMPPESFLDIGHYAGEFSGIFEAMASVGDSSLQTLCLWNMVAAVAILLVGGAIGAALIFGESKLLHKWKLLR